MSSSVDRHAARCSRRVRIREFSISHLGERFTTANLHCRFGSAFRTRVSELNRDLSCPIQILNESTAGRGERGESCERSVYCSEPLRSEQPPHTEPDFMRRHRKEEARNLPLLAEVSR